MLLSENIRLAFDAIRQNRLRTILTFSIITFGIMALIGILTSIDSLKESLSGGLSGIGASTFNIVPKGMGLQGGGPRRKKVNISVITYEDAVSFKEKYRYPSTVSLSVLATTLGELGNGTKKTNPNVVINGVDENYLGTAGYEVEYGRGFTLEEAASTQNIIVLGHDVVDLLFDNPEKAVGQDITFHNSRYKVIGVLKGKGSSMSFAGDRLGLVPLVNARQYFGSQTSSYNISVTVGNVNDMEWATSEAIGAFRPIRKLNVEKEDDFEIQKSDGLLKIILEDTATIRFAAIFIGLITLAGAAIGLMNIMLVSVTERTREIGICKSLGATRNTILIQFLTEAIIICQIGGFFGVFFGILIGNLVSLLLGSTFIIPWMWIGLGFVLCLLTGIIAGLYPAIKAAKLDPIEALRYE